MKNFIRIVGIILLTLAIVIPASYWLWLLEVKIIEGFELKKVGKQIATALNTIKIENKTVVVISLIKAANQSSSSFPEYQLTDVTTGQVVQLPQDLLLQKTANSRAVHLVLYRPSRFRNFSQRIAAKPNTSVSQRLALMFKKLVDPKPQKVPIGGFVIDKGSVLQYSYPIHSIITQSYYVDGDYPEIITVVPAPIPYINRVKLKPSEYLIKPFSLGGTIDWITPISERALICSQNKYYALERRTGTTNFCTNFTKLLPSLTEPPTVLHSDRNTLEKLLIANLTTKDKTNKLHNRARGVFYDIQGDNIKSTAIDWPGRLYVLGRTPVTGYYFAIGNLNLEERLKTKRIAPPNFLLEISSQNPTAVKLAPLPLNLEVSPNLVFLEKIQSLVIPAADNTELRIIKLPQFELEQKTIKVPADYKILEITKLN